MPLRHGVLAAMLCVLTTSGVAHAASRIGVAAAISNQVTGTVGGSAKPLRAGDGVFQNQVVRTRARSTGQFLFLDQTALTVGPGSRVKLDRYVYDPSRRVGKIVINTTKGAFRFVSGAAKSSSYRIKTPAAAIGVRGTIFDWFIDAAGNMIVVLVRGAVEVCPYRRSCIVISVPGHSIAVRKDGTATQPRRARGRLWSVAQGVPFPLFGNQFENDFSTAPVGQDFIEERGYGGDPNTGTPRGGPTTIK